jgi:hypothetical protein
MSATRLWVLVALAVAVAGGAYWLSTQSTLRRDPDYGTRVLPGLAATLDAVNSIKLVGAGGRTLVTLTRDDGRWRVAEAGYPADAARVRRLLVALGELHVVEAKTEDPARYPALAVEDVEAAAAQSLRLELRGPPTPLALIVGHAAAGQGAYVRVPGQRQAFEVRPSLDVPREPHGWLARTIVDLAPARVQSLEVEPAGGPAWRAVKAARDAAHFDVPGLPKGRELASLGAADGVGSALATLEFEEVRKAEPPAGRVRPERATLRTFDGLVVSLEGHREGEARWLTIAASVDAAQAARFPPAAGQSAPGAEAVKSEAERIAATSAGWEYRVSAYRYDAIFGKRDALLRH